MPRFLAIEPILTSRVSALLEDLPQVRVLSRASYAQLIKGAGLPAQAVIVSPWSYTVQRDKHRMDQHEELWLTVVSVRNVASPVGGEDARAEAGPLLDLLMDGLRYWKPASTELPVKVFEPSERVPLLSWDEQGRGYFPLAWKVTLPGLPPACGG